MICLLVLTLILGLIPTVALTEDAVKSTCEVATVLVSGAELGTIHENVLCLHQRLDVIREELKRKSGEESEGGKYVVLQPNDEEGSSGDPCERDGSYNAMLCYYSILRTFGSFCTTGNCAEGLDPWRDYMPPKWQNYLNERNIYIFTPGTWAEDVLNKPNWFTLDKSQRRMLNMEKFFGEMSPGQVLKPMHIPQFQGTGQTITMD